MYYISGKTNISARVDITIKKIRDSIFTHNDSYELGEKVIVMGNAEYPLLLENNINFNNLIVIEISKYCNENIILYQT